MAEATGDQGPRRGAVPTATFCGPTTDASGSNEVRFPHSGFAGRRRKRWQHPGARATTGAPGPRPKSGTRSSGWSKSSNCRSLARASKNQWRKIRLFNGSRCVKMPSPVAARLGWGADDRGELDADRRAEPGNYRKVRSGITFVNLVRYPQDFFTDLGLSDGQRGWFARGETSAESR